MKREIYICDRCGREIGEKNEYTVKMRNGTLKTDYDFCPMCAASCENVIDNFMKGQATDKEPVSEETEPKPEKRTPTKYSSEVMQEVHELRASGLNIKEVAEKLGIMLSTLYAWLKKEKGAEDQVDSKIQAVARDILAAGD